MFEGIVKSREFWTNTVSGVKAAVQHPSVIVTGTIQTLKTAGQPISPRGRSQLSGSGVP